MPDLGVLADEEKTIFGFIVPSERITITGKSHIE
jgi:hypothetical protein